jgi:hypothetical protein
VTKRRLSKQQLWQLASDLTPRDKVVLDSVARLRVVAGKQLVRLHFEPTPASERQARRTLARLVERRLLARLERRVGGVRAGSDGYVYALDVGGQRLLDATHGRAARRPWTPGERWLRHSLAVSELYVRLVEAERTSELELLDFATEPACWRRYAGPAGAALIVKPDAYLRLGVGRDELVWFVEVDCATEGPAAITRQLRSYQAYWQSGREQADHGVFPRVLWLAPSARRQQALVDITARQPAEARALFQVTRFDAAVGVLGGGQP